jgi:hypothetical protein
MDCIHSAMRQLSAGQSRIPRSRSQGATNQDQGGVSLLVSFKAASIYSDADVRLHLSSDLVKCDFSPFLALCPTILTFFVVRNTYRTQATLLAVCSTLSLLLFFTESGQLELPRRLHLRGSKAKDSNIAEG